MSVQFVTLEGTAMNRQKKGRLPLHLPGGDAEEAFGAWAKDRREHLGLTQVEMSEAYRDTAAELGIEGARKRTPEWFSNLEHGKVQVQDMAEFRILATLYVVSELELLAAMGFDVSGDLPARLKRSPLSRFRRGKFPA